MLSLVEPYIQYAKYLIAGSLFRYSHAILSIILSVRGQFLTKTNSPTNGTRSRSDSEMPSVGNNMDSSSTYPLTDLFQVKIHISSPSPSRDTKDGVLKWSTEVWSLPWIIYSDCAGTVTSHYFHCWHMHTKCVVFLGAILQIRKTEKKVHLWVKFWQIS